MKPRLVARTGARTVAADVVARVLDDGAWAQPALSSALSASLMDARDKALCTELVYGTLRWCASLEASLLRATDKPAKGLDRKIRPHLLVAAYQLQHLGERIPARAAVNEAVDAVRNARPGLDGFANAVLRRLGSAPHTTLPPSSSPHDFAAALGIPDVLADAVASLLPPSSSELRAALEGLNARPSTYGYALRDVNATTRHAFVPNAFVVEAGAVVDGGGFKDGAYLVMDPGSVVAALLVAPASTTRVLDLCAAPGSKSVVLAHAGARVVAVEKSDKRAERIRENAVRTKLADRIDVVIADALSLPATVRATPYDAVLLDAPCTGFGTTRRKPEIKLRRTAADVDNDAKLQSSLLAQAASLVKPGGALVYSVCSPLAAEGVAHIDALLARGGFTIADARETLPWLPVDAVDERGLVHLLPHRHDCDAFFAARLVRDPRAAATTTSAR